MVLKKSMLKFQAPILDDHVGVLDQGDLVLVDPALVAPDLVDLVLVNLVLVDLVLVNSDLVDQNRFHRRARRKLLLKIL